MVNQTQSDVESDAALLACFARLRDEQAFAELMRRHGPMVLAIASRMLRQQHDAEDALQAVFLTLARRARALQRVRSVAGWLHNVAVRISLNLLKMKRRREAGLRKLQQDRSEFDESEPHELLELLDEELAQLPARLKETLILRDLEGYSRSEVAQKLGVPAGTVDSRLSYGRKLLRDRLARRGVTVGAGGLAAALANCAGATAVLPPELIHQTFRITELFLLGSSISGVPAITNITSLAQRELNTMFLSKLSTAVGIAALVAVFLLGTSPAAELFGFRSVAQASRIFLDDFEDGSVTDGNPVNWSVPSSVPNGQFRVENGDLVLTPSNITPTIPSVPGFTEMQVLADGLNVQDLSLRTQVRGLSPTSGVPYGIAISARDTFTSDNDTGTGIFAVILSDGFMFFGSNLDRTVNGPGTSTNFGQVQTGLNFVTEAVNLQLDVVGDQARLTAWGASQPKPQSPQLTGTVSPSLDKSGSVKLAAYTMAGTDWNRPVAFRYVEVAAIPEPSSIALGSLSGVALASFAFRNRLLRIR